MKKIIMFFFLLGIIYASSIKYNLRDENSQTSKFEYELSKILTPLQIQTIQKTKPIIDFKVTYCNGKINLDLKIPDLTDEREIGGRTTFQKLVANYFPYAYNFGEDRVKSINDLYKSIFRELALYYLTKEAIDNITMLIYKARLKIQGDTLYKSLFTAYEECIKKTALETTRAKTGLKAGVGSRTDNEYGTGIDTTKLLALSTNENKCIKEFRKHLSDKNKKLYDETEKEVRHTIYALLNENVNIPFSIRKDSVCSIYEKLKKQEKNKKLNNSEDKVTIELPISIFLKDINEKEKVAMNKIIANQLRLKANNILSQRTFVLDKGNTDKENNNGIFRNEDIVYMIDNQNFTDFDYYFTSIFSSNKDFTVFLNKVYKKSAKDYLKENFFSKEAFKNLNYLKLLLNKIILIKKVDNEMLDFYNCMLFNKCKYNMTKLYFATNYYDNLDLNSTNTLENIYFALSTSDEISRFNNVKNILSNDGIDYGIVEEDSLFNQDTKDKSTTYFLKFNELTLILNYLNEKLPYSATSIFYKKVFLDNLKSSLKEDRNNYYLDTSDLFLDLINDGDFIKLSYDFSNIFTFLKLVLEEGREKAIKVNKNSLDILLLINKNPNDGLNTIENKLDNTILRTESFLKIELSSITSLGDLIKKNINLTPVFSPFSKYLETIGVDDTVLPKYYFSSISDANMTKLHKVNFISLTDEINSTAYFNSLEKTQKDLISELKSKDKLKEIYLLYLNFIDYYFDMYIQELEEKRKLDFANFYELIYDINNQPTKTLLELYIKQKMVNMLIKAYNLSYFNIYYKVKAVQKEIEHIKDMF
jgi:hypothetical protein